MYADKRERVVEAKGYTYCFGDVILLLKCVQREWVGSFGLFKHIYFIDRPLEQKVIKQRLRYNKIMGVKVLSAVDPQMI